MFGLQQSFKIHAFICAGGWSGDAELRVRMSPDPWQVEFVHLFPVCNVNSGILTEVHFYS